MRTSSAFAALLFSAGVLSCGYQPRSTYAHAPKRPEAKAAPTKSTVKRNVVSFGRVVGSDVATIDPDGAIVVALDVLENGRGPHVDATIKLAPGGTIAAFDARGHHEMGTPVEESFARDAGHARWKSKEEAGERDGAASAFFVPMAEVPDTLGLLAQAALKAGGTIKLLPDGEAHIEKTAEMTLRGKNGKDRHVVGYMITGLDLTPTRLWMNDDGTWFGYVNPWWSIVPEGWESSIDPLVEKQNQLDRERDAKLAKTHAHRPPPAGLAYTHAKVLDVDRGRWLADQTVVVVGDTIKTVGPSARVQVPAGAETIDLTGKALLPGLWDMHSHLGDADGVLDVASGVTTARDVGNDPDKLDDFKKRFDEGSAIGPRVYRMGFIEGRNEKSASSKITAENEQEALAAVDFFQKRGYDGIKIYNSMKPELVPLLAKEAHAKGMSVTGHIPVHMLANEAVKAGYDGIEHINMLFLNFFATHDTDTRDTTRFTLVGDKAASFDLKSKPAQEFFALLKEKKTVVDPTVGVFETLLIGQQGKIIPGLEPMVARLPVQTQRGYLAGGLPLESKEQLYKDSFEKVLAMIKTLYEQKITLVIGTDALAGLWVHHELALFVRAGVPAAAALRMATLDAARSMKLDFKTGSIAENKAADMFVVDGDPLARIDDVGRVVSTMRGGVVFPSAPLYDAVGVKAIAAPAAAPAAPAK
jgi:imidazolonepropionase-like amidohydrolase